MYDMYRNHVDTFWTPDDVDFTTNDPKSWRKLSDHDRSFITKVHVILASKEVEGLENITENFTREVKLAEARAFQGFQVAMKNMHLEAYAVLLEQFCPDEFKVDVFAQMSELSAMKKKALWAKKNITNSKCFAQRLVAFAC